MGINTRGNMNCPKKHIKDDFACDGILSDSENFGTFQINGQMSSHDKMIFHMLFGAFHITPLVSTMGHSVFYTKLFSCLYQKFQIKTES